MENDIILLDQEKVDKEDDETYLDLSISNLTTVPASIFKRKEITKLDLSQNNIRGVPSEISELKNLKYLDLSKNGFRCTNPDDTTILPHSLMKLKNLEYLNLSECSLIVIPNILWNLITLKYLDISRNKTGILPSSVGNLDKLKWLSCQHMGLTGIPEELVGCRSLQTLLLYGNPITESIPTVLSDLPHLKEISMNIRDMVDNVIDDENTRALLKTNQIRSEHISSTLFQLASLETLNLSYCDLNYLRNFKSSSKLTHLDLSGNYFKEIPFESLSNLDNLTYLNLSHNLLSQVPKLNDIFYNLLHIYLDSNQITQVHTSLFQLPSLITISLNNNQIKTINFFSSSTISTTPDNWTLKSLFMSSNKLIVIPDSIGKFKGLQNLDVTNNLIKELPVELSDLVNIDRMHGYNGLYRTGLWLINNPIEFPNSFNWKTTNSQHLFTFLEKVKLQRINKQTPVKVILLGNDDSVKHKFLYQLLSRSTSTGKLNQSPKFLSIHQWTSPNLIPFVFVNISSNNNYNLLWNHFIDDNSLIWLFINDSDLNIDHLKYWLKFLHKQSDIVIQLIHYNKSEQDDLVINDDFENKINSINDELLNKFDQYLLNNNFKFIKSSFTFKYNSDNYLNEFIERLEIDAVNKDLFKEISHFKLLTKEATLIEKVCKEEKCIYIKYDELIQKVNEKCLINEDIIRLCLQILHRKGKLLWFGDYENLSSKIYPFISIFINSITNLLRDSYDDELDYDCNHLLKSEALLDESRLEMTKINFLNYGEMSLPLYKVLMFDLNKNYNLKDFLVDCYICWYIPLEFVSEVDIYARPYIVFPQMNKVEIDIDYFLNDVLNINDNKLVNESFKIICNDLVISNRVFIKCTCALNKLSLYRYDWKGFSYLVNENGGDAILHKSKNDDVYLIIRSYFDGLDLKGNEWLNKFLESIGDNNLIVERRDLSMQDYVRSI